ncbi:MAG TPA: alpha/beta hydrolase [Pyrinomonadaceae bacterium]|nr:alpha/beta hydrolase [Pyrinomonadaceae bacterium]
MEEQEFSADSDYRVCGKRKRFGFRFINRERLVAVSVALVFAMCISFFSLLYGQSLGTTAVVDLASRRQSNAIILESGLSSASEMAASVLPWFPSSLHFLLRNRFDSLEKLKKVKSPVLITHGDPDPVIPTDQGRQLFAAANEPKRLLIFPGAGHDVFGSVGNSYLDLVATFITAAVGP